VLWQRLKEIYRNHRAGNAVVGSEKGPHPLIPSRGEMAILKRLIIQGKGRVYGPRWHRGAVYWEGLRVGGTHQEAVDFALEPEFSRVSFKIERV